jgi:hypothetical protein
MTDLLLRIEHRIGERELSSFFRIRNRFPNVRKPTSGFQVPAYSDCAIRNNGRAPREPWQMSKKKDLANLSIDLAALASTMPVQRPPHVIGELTQIAARIRDLEARVDRLEADEKRNLAAGLE